MSLLRLSSTQFVGVVNLCCSGLLLFHIFRSSATNAWPKSILPLHCGYVTAAAIEFPHLVMHRSPKSAVNAYNFCPVTFCVRLSHCSYGRDVLCSNCVAIVAQLFQNLFKMYNRLICYKFGSVELD